MAKCHDCRRPIVYVLLAGASRPFPVDAVPDDKGRIIARRGADNQLRGRWLAKDETPPDGALIYLAHKETCQVAMRDRITKAKAKPPTPEPAPTLFDTHPEGVTTS